MPKILVFAPCIKTIGDAEDGSLSVINVLTGITVALTEDARPDTKFISPIVWSVGILWGRQPEDEGQRYEQRLTLVEPDGYVGVSVPSIVVMTTPAVRSISNVHGFPTSADGICTVRLELRNITEEMKERPWREIATFPITVTLRPTTPS